MSLNIKQSGSNKTDLGRIEDGSYPARVAQIIDLGQQHDTVWLNGESKPLYYAVGDDGKNIKGEDGFTKKVTEDTGNPVIMPKVWITFEFPTERIEVDGEDRPRWQSKEYNVTGKGALAKLVGAVAPGKGSIAAILGKPCLVQIGSTSGGNAKVMTVGPMMKGMAVAKLESEAKVFDRDSPDMEVMNSLPEFLQEKIKSAKNWKAREVVESAPAPFDDFDDDIPY